MLMGDNIWDRKSGSVWLCRRRLKLTGIFSGNGTILTTVITELPWGLELTQQRFIMVVRKQSDYVAAAFFNVPNGFMERTNGVVELVKRVIIQSQGQALKDHLRLEGLATYFAATMICCPLNKGHAVD
ncbi:hypothetical protein Tco_0421086 [Tanacetum coccineum]